MTGNRSAARAGQPFVLLAVVCVAVVVAVVAGVTPPLSAARFANTGHWMYNSVLGVVFHVDGATSGLDADFPIDAEVGSQVLQGDTSGWVVGPGRITEFDKGSLTPGQSTKPPSDEVPLGIEVVGGPYAVYRDAAGSSGSATRPRRSPPTAPSAPRWSPRTAPCGSTAPARSGSARCPRTRWRSRAARCPRRRTTPVSGGPVVDGLHRLAVHLDTALWSGEGADKGTVAAAWQAVADIRGALAGRSLGARIRAVFTIR